MSWDAARSSCRCNNSAELASISNSTEDNLLALLAGTVENTWVGGHDLHGEGTFTWTDNTTWSFTNWNDNQPNNGGTDGNQDCVSLRPDGKWDDVVCTTARQYACEKPDSDQVQLTSSGACSCDQGWTGSLDTGKCYKRGNDTNGVQWSAARTNCQVK